MLAHAPSLPFVPLFFCFRSLSPSCLLCGLTSLFLLFFLCLLLPFCFISSSSLCLHFLCSSSSCLVSCSPFFSLLLVLSFFPSFGCYISLSPYPPLFLSLLWFSFAFLLLSFSSFYLLFFLFSLLLSGPAIFSFVSSSPLPSFSDSSVICFLHIFFPYRLFLPFLLLSFPASSFA